MALKIENLTAGQVVKASTNRFWQGMSGMKLTVTTIGDNMAHAKDEDDIQWEIDNRNWTVEEV